MTDQYVRVQHADTGHQYTVGKDKAANDPKLKIVDRPATNLSGYVLPPKYRTRIVLGVPNDPADGDPADGETDASEESA